MRIGPWVSRCSLSGVSACSPEPYPARPGGQPVHRRACCGDAGDGRGLKHFYVKAYTDNLTGLAGMVAYSLLLRSSRWR